jgi:hypothetical protein
MVHGDSCDVRGRRSLYPAIKGVNGSRPKSASVFDPPPASRQECSVCLIPREQLLLLRSRILHILNARGKHVISY